MSPGTAIRTNSAGQRVAAARACDTTVRMPAVGRAPKPDESAETVQLDEAAVAQLRRARDAELIEGAIDLEARIRVCGKHDDADLVRALRERVADAMGDTP